MIATVQPLKKLRLRVSKCKGPGVKPDGRPVFLEFIFGVASNGLCPFETVLLGKKEGDVFPVSISSDRARDYFGHILADFRQVFGLEVMVPRIFLEIEVVGIAQAENREVVQSLARALAHGTCGGSCGCGCG